MTWALRIESEEIPVGEISLVKLPDISRPIRLTKLLFTGKNKAFRIRSVQVGWDLWEVGAFKDPLTISTGELEVLDLPHLDTRGPRVLPAGPKVVLEVQNIGLTPTRFSAIWSYENDLDDDGGMKTPWPSTTYRPPPARVPFSLTVKPNAGLNTFTLAHSFADRCRVRFMEFDQPGWIIERVFVGADLVGAMMQSELPTNAFLPGQPALQLDWNVHTYASLSIGLSRVFVSEQKQYPVKDRPLRRTFWQILMGRPGSPGPDELWWRTAPFEPVTISGTFILDTTYPPQKQDAAPDAAAEHPAHAA